MATSSDTGEVIVYSLTTCGHCKSLRRHLDSLGVAYRVIYVDMLCGEERNRVRRRVRDLNPAFTFPTTVVGEVVVAGFNEAALSAAVSDLMNQR